MKIIISAAAVAALTLSAAACGTSTPGDSVARY